MSKGKIIAIVAVIILGVAAGAFYYMRTQTATDQTRTEQTPPQPQPPSPSPAAVEQPKEETVPDKAVAKMETSEGTFEITLDGKTAPKTVANFIKLSKQGFYNNLTFHRIVQDFVIQGGDPKGDGTGGPGYTVPAEISLKHTKGAVAMARLGDAANPTKASSGSQFYIALQALPSLDGQYTVFGIVSAGMDVVEKIARTPTEPNPFSGEVSSPLKTVTIKSITITQ